MFTQNKIVYLYHKQVLSSYAIANKKVFSPPPKILGTTLTAVNKMLSYSDEMKVLMPEILGISPSSPNWDSSLSYYWNSISEEIEVSGKTLQVGYTFDINAYSKQSHIQLHNKTASDSDKFNKSEDIAKYFDRQYSLILDDFNSKLLSAKKISNLKDSEKLISELYTIKYNKIVELESQKYKYGTPINIADYILYRFCLVHSQVANEFALSDKSNNIRFYLHSEDEIKQYKEEKLKLEKERMTIFLEVVKSSDKVENILYALGFGSEIQNLDFADMNIKLNSYSLENPQKFINIANNKNLEKIGLVEKYIHFGLLKRLDNTNIVVDGINPDLILGNSIEEVLSYISNDKNKAYLSELNARYKGLPKN